MTVNGLLHHSVDLDELRAYWRAHPSTRVQVADRDSREIASNADNGPVFLRSSSLVSFPLLDENDLFPWPAPPSLAQLEVPVAQRASHELAVQCEAHIIASAADRHDSEIASNEEQFSDASKSQ